MSGLTSARQVRLQWCAVRGAPALAGVWALVQVEHACGLCLRRLAWLMSSRGSVSCCRGCVPWWRQRTPRTRSCGRSWRRPRSGSGGWSCGWRSWSAGCGWTAPIRARRPRRSRSGQENAAGRSVRNLSGSAGRTRRRGGQPGHPGRGLARDLDPDPDQRKDAGPPPAQCRRCGTGTVILVLVPSRHHQVGGERRSLHVMV
jgi:hypothetical protein